MLDNFSTGCREFLIGALGSSNFDLLEGDLLDVSRVSSAVAGVDVVVHLAANADVRFGWDNPRRDYEQNVVATHNLLEAMREHSVKRLLFSSTGSVYGESSVIPTPEDAPFPRQTSLYGASKCAAEGLIAAYAEAGFIHASVFRFVSILGPRYTHGHVIDFVAQLFQDPKRLKVLGNGEQKKSYLHVSDCVSALTLRLEASPAFEVLNLGLDDYCEVNQSVAWITSKMELSPEITYGGGRQGWVGDSPFIFLDTSLMKGFGWKPQHTIHQAILSTTEWILENQWILSRAVTKSKHKGD